MKRWMVALTVLLLSTSAFAGGFTTDKEMKAFSDQFMDKIVSLNFKEAFNATKPSWPLPEVEIDGIVNQIAQQWPMINNRFGESLAKEFIKEKRIGKSFLRYYYLHKFTNHSLYWFIDFYKAKDTWLINKVVFQDDLNALYE